MILATIIGFFAFGALIVFCATCSHNAEERERQRRAELLKKGGTIK